VTGFLKGKIIKIEILSFLPSSLPFTQLGSQRRDEWEEGTDLSLHSFRSLPHPTGDRKVRSWLGGSVSRLVPHLIPSARSLRLTRWRWSA